MNNSTSSSSTLGGASSHADPTQALEQNRSPICIDVMGSDRGPLEVVEGACEAARLLSIPVLLVGDESEIQQHLQTYTKKFSLQNLSALVSVHHATQTVEMTDAPTSVLRAKVNSSVRVAFDLVKSGRAAGVVSAGNTGAMMAAGMAVCGTLPGIGRPAIASLVPRPAPLSPTVLLDSGANVDCHAYQLVQFAVMGACYAQAALKIEQPRIGLLSNGSEPSKGNDLIRSAAQRLAEIEGLHYTGFVEGGDIWRDVVDVVVCDGLSGNVLLKGIEGTVGMVFRAVEEAVASRMSSKVGWWLSFPALRQLFGERLDPSAYGGAPLLGLNTVAVVCHGASNARAVTNAVRVADSFAQGGFVTQMREALAGLDSGSISDYRDGFLAGVGQSLVRNPKKKISREETKE